MCMTSCTYFYKNKKYEPCKFYPDEFLVIGADTNEKEIKSDSNYVTANIMDLMGVNANLGYRVTRKDFFSKKYFSYKITHCKDTSWAKSKILQEVNKRYPYEIIDTIERHKVYNMTFLDTTIFVPRVYDDLMLIGFAIYPAYELTYNREYPSVLMQPIQKAIENEGVKVKLGKVFPLAMDTNRYNIKLSREFTDFPIHLSRYFDYLRDEFCVEVNLVEDFIIPIKIIRLK